MNIALSITDSPAPADDAFIRKGLEEYNLRFAPADQHRLLVVLARNETGELVGGLLGGTFWRWLHIDILWVREDTRGQGLGKQLMAAAEAEAVRRDCLHAMVDTMSFQAPDFYKGLGYTMWGVLEDVPPGHQRIFFRKDLKK